MSGFNAAFKAEVMRLARKEFRAQAESMQKATSLHRREIAQLKREIKSLEAQVRRLGKTAGSAPRAAARAAPSTGETPRFSPKWLKAHRKKIGFSAREYALLVGVSMLTVYNWEGGKSKPRAKQLVKLAALRGLGKREAEARLAEIEG